MSALDMAQSRSDLTSDLVAELRAIATGDLPDDVIAIAKLCILDWLGVTIAGANEPLVQMLLEEMPADAKGACTLIGLTARAAPIHAALINGAAGDALDYSDCIRVMNGHATATVLPAALALAEAQASSGNDLVRAFVLGVEAACRTGVLVGEGILATPFHPTAVLGPFGAAAAAAQLMGLDADAWSAAFAIAATTAAGLAASVGTMSKPLHAGTAAANGLLAARLARRGFTGAPGVFEHPHGFVAAHSTKIDPGALAAARGRFFIRETLVKQHAACQLTHGSIENMLRIRSATAFAADDIKQIRLAIAPSSLRICDIVAPRSGLEAKFSIRTLAAMALLGLATDRLETYTDALVHAPEIAKLRDRISVDGRVDLPVERSVAEVELRDGRILRAQTDERELDQALDSRRERVRAKFLNLTNRHMDRDRAAELEAIVLNIDQVNSIDTLVRKIGLASPRRS
jgi:2-methylcitrate dehydratase PrpD